MLFALCFIPAAAGIMVFLIRSAGVRRLILITSAALHTAMTAFLWTDFPPRPWYWLEIDAAGLVFLTVISLLFLAASVFALGYLRREGHGSRKDVEEGFLFTNEPETIFIGCLLFFLSTMTLTTVSRNFGLLWIAIEGTTLASAPLIFFHRHHRSLEATWKYLLVCSVGIALALLGNFFLGVAAASAGPGGQASSLNLDALLRCARLLDIPWLKAAFILMLVGYGTKMGLAPMHTWLPDAHSEAPSVISALLSGAVLNCAFLGVLRIYQVASAAGLQVFGGEMLMVLGLVSIGIAALFILRQSDFKRLLAYSSVENMGILTFGAGIGGLGMYGSMLHLVNHSLVKGMLFLIAGNIMTTYHTKQITRITGLRHVLPVSGLLWFAGFLAISGMPPFGIFYSKLTILRAAVEGHLLLAVLYLVLLAVVFIGMSRVFIRMTFGASTGLSAVPLRDKLLVEWPPLVLLLIVLAMGLFIPQVLDARLHEIVSSFGGMP
jgi:hydrogenase-4 component F